MKSWESILVSPATTLGEALTRIDSAGSKMALVVDHQKYLLGTLSDGDARRALLKGLNLSDPVSGAMHVNPTCAHANDSKQSVLMTMRQRGLHQIPLVNANGIVMGMAVIDDFLTAPERNNWVVIMAGGLGKRLEHLTKDTPKPMLKVGSRPLLETILTGYSDQGFRRFYFAVNYKAEQIEQYFGDGDRFGVEIRYLREDRHLGTAGPLSLIPDSPDQHLVVANGDLLTKEDIGDMVDRHIGSAADATMAVREYEMQVPFGVVRESNGLIVGIEEKPIQQFIVSAGIYILSPEVVSLVPKNTYFDMPQLFEGVTARGLTARTHRIEGYWLDIGRLADYERANLEFNEIFK